MRRFIHPVTRWACVLIVVCGFDFIAARTGRQVLAAPVSFDTRAFSGEPAPGTGTGVVFSAFDAVVLNAAGQTAFRGTINGNGVDDKNNSGIWSDRHGSLGIVARTGGTATGAGSGVRFSTLFNPLLDASGQSAFFAFLTGTDMLQRWSIWSESGGSLDLVARDGDVAPGTGGAFFSSFGGISSPGDNPDFNSIFVFNSAGETAFRASITGPGVTFRNSTGIWSKESGALKLVARAGDESPGAGPGSIFNVFVTDNTRHPVKNGAGQTLFSGQLFPTSETGIWLAENGALRLVVLEGDAAPDTGEDSYFGPFMGVDYAINDAGQLAFFARGVDLPNFENYTSIWNVRDGSLRRVVREGEAAPGTSPGVTFRSLIQNLALNGNLLFNGAGHTAFYADLTGPGVVPSNDFGLWIDDGNSLSLVVREGDSAPGTSAAFSLINDVELNGVGQFAFTSILTGAGITELNNRGLWVRDLSGATRMILRAGDLFDVNDSQLVEDLRTVLGIDLSTHGRGYGGEDGRRTGFNEAGQLAVLISFTDGSQGVFVATIPPVPEPTSLHLAFLVSLGVIAYQRQSR